jgi:hypothetical protein
MSLPMQHTWYFPMHAVDVPAFTFSVMYQPQHHPIHDPMDLSMSSAKTFVEFHHLQQKPKLVDCLLMLKRLPVPIKTALEEMGHPQPTTGTPLETDNSTAHDILTATVRMKRSKAFDMRYHWLKDRIAQKQFNLYWAPGKLNKADYHTKHFPPAYHKAERYQPFRLQDTTHLVNILTSQLRGCVAPRSIHGPRSCYIYDVSRQLLVAAANFANIRRMSPHIRNHTTSTLIY